MIIELFHKELKSATLESNLNNQVSIHGDTYCWEFAHPPQDITIKYSPKEIIPKLRIDGFLVDNWVANVKIHDSCLNVRIGDDFAVRYRHKDLQGRISSLGNDPSRIVLDRNVGNELHSDLIDKINTLINEKSSSN